MTSALRREFVLLAAIVLMSAAALVWLGNSYSATAAAGLVMGGAVGVVLVPAIVLQAWARVRNLGKSLHWWHWIWAFLFLSELVFRQRDAQTLRDDPLDAWAIYRVSLVGLSGLVLMWRVMTRRLDWLLSLSSGLMLAMAAYPLAGILSTAWSVFPTWTAYRSIEFLVDVAVIAAAIAAVGTPDNMRSLFNWNWLLLYLLQASVWVGAIVAPEKAWFATPGSIRLQLNGVVPDIAANGVGHIAAILAIVALSRLLTQSAKPRSGFLYWLMLATSLATLVMAQTRSALTGFIAAAVLVLLLSGRLLTLLATAYGMAVLLLATSAESTFLAYFRRGQDTQEWTSLSGRTTWWSFAWSRFLERPFTGFGAFAGGRFAALVEMGDQSTSSVHNTYLEAILGIGILGIVPLLICIVGTWWTLLKAFLSRTASGLRHSLNLEATGVLMVVTVRSVFTTDLIWHAALPWLLVLGYAELLRRERKAVAR